jgi:hypothetical protein
MQESEAGIDEPLGSVTIDLSHPDAPFSFVTDGVETAVKNAQPA